MRRARWVVAIGVVAIVAVVSAAGVFFLSGAGGAARSITAENAPAETLVFIDLRTDLPGDQHQKLADFLTHFPGFKDRAQFENAFDELLNRITSRISPQLTYTSAFKSWSSGEISIAVTNLGLTGGPASGASIPIPGGSIGMPGASPQGALIVSLKDRAAGEKWVASEAAETGLPFTQSSYAGTTLFEAGDGADRVAYAFTDRVLLAGNAEAVKAGLDAPAKGSLAQTENYKTAMKSLGGDRVAAFYLDPRALIRAEVASIAEALGPLGDLVDASKLELAAVPAWAAGSVRAESDRMVVEMRLPKPAQAPRSGSRESALLSRLPGSSVAVVELRSLSEISTQLIDALAGQDPEGAKRLADQIVEAIRTIGGIDWIGDTALVVTGRGSAYGAGVVVRTPDAKTATEKKALLHNLGALADLLPLPNGLSLSQSSWTYKGTDVSRLTISGESMSPLAIDIATRDELLIAGSGETFMKEMLDTTERTSLARQDDFRRVMGYAGTSSSSFAYADLSAIVDDLGRAFLASDPQDYELNLAPYLDGLDSLGCSIVDGQTVILRLVVTVK